MRIQIRIVSQMALLSAIVFSTGCASETETTRPESTPVGQSSVLSGMHQNVQALVQAAGKGDLVTVKRLLQNGIKVDNKSKDGITALMAACKNKQSDMAMFLLDSGASPNLAAPVGEGEDTAAWTFGYVGICKDEQTIRGATPLFFAAQAGALDIVQMLLEKEADVDAITANGATALYIACQMGNKEVVRLFLARKSNPNTKTKYGWTPLFVTAYKGDADTAQLLLDAGADVNATGSMLMVPKIVADPRQIGMKKIEGISALYVASLAGKPDVVKLLLSKGAYPGAKTSDGETAADAALFVKSEAVIQLLRQDNSAENR